MATIGFAGLGHMGTPMAGRLAAAGYRLRVYDIAPAARARHQGIDGVAVVSQVAEIADGADVVILMLPDSAVVAQVLLADGLLEHVASSAVVVDMSSSVPARTRELARTAAERGVTLIDAPVSGGVAGARSGSLTIMAGGPADVLDHATSEIAIGTKLGIDATRKLSGEGFKRPWPPLIRMDPETRAKVEKWFKT